MRKTIILILLSNTLLAQNKIEVLKSFDSLQGSKKTLEDAKIAFEYINKVPIQSFTKKEKANNCENKAEFSFVALKKFGFKPSIFWLLKEGFIEADYNTQDKVEKSSGLLFNTGVGRNSFVLWGYHAATGVLIDGEIYICDPWTQSDVVKLNKWALSFYHKQFNTEKSRTAYIFHVNDKYKYFGTDEIGKLSLDKNEWLKNIDVDSQQMYCGLAGITPNSKCSKKRFKKRILKKKNEIEFYLNGIK